MLRKKLQRSSKKTIQHSLRSPIWVWGPRLTCRSLRISLMMFSRRLRHLKGRLLTCKALLASKRKSKKNWRMNGHRRKQKLLSKTLSLTIEKKIFLDIRKRLRSWTSSSSSLMRRSETSEKTLLPRKMKLISWDNALDQWTKNWNSIIQSMLLLVT